MNYDVICVGGGLGGASLAHALVRDGLRVLVLERESTFKDRVRGEGLLPWGVNEAKQLGVYDTLAACGVVVRYWTSHGWKKRPPRDLAATTPNGACCLDFYHPEMQEAMLGAAEAVGADVRRGVTVREVRPGAPPSVTVEHDGRSETLTARLVVGADGRGSRVREQTGLTLNRDPERLIAAGLLLDNTTVPDHSVHVFRVSEKGTGALFFPQPNGRTRSYYIYRLQGERLGLSGAAAVARALQAYRDTGVPADWIDRATAGGPLAEFSGFDTWVEHPYTEGVALVGDAASTNDPAWGNGLSLTLRDVRALREALNANDDWTAAGVAYGQAHATYFLAIRRVTRWLTSLMYEVGPEADAARARAFPLMQTDRSRSLDYIALGPDTPSDEETRRRFFGEDVEPPAV